MLKLFHSSRGLNTMSLVNTVRYNVPEWAAKLKIAPKSRISLGHLNTPIHPWHLADVPTDFKISLKRDDMTGSTCSGNKIRKLEFLLAEAIDQGCRHVITCGGIQSNHVRATVVAATQLGLKAHALLRTDDEDIGSRGNLLLNQLCGASLYIVPRKSPNDTHMVPRMKTLQDTIRDQTGEKAYSIPVGGSTTIGMYGYLEAFNELIEQNCLTDYDDIVVTCGSGGTMDGLAIANYLTGSKLKIHGICVSDSSSYFYDHLDHCLSEVGITAVKGRDIVDFVDGYKGRGYALSTQEELDFIFAVSESTGIMLDPVYTGKGAYGLVQEINNNPGRFHGKRILFIHTGGLFGMFDGSLDKTLPKKIIPWKDMDSTPELIL